MNVINFKYNTFTSIIHNINCNVFFVYFWIVRGTDRISISLYSCQMVKKYGINGLSHSTSLYFKNQ